MMKVNRLYGLFATVAAVACGVSALGIRPEPKPREGDAPKPRPTPEPPHPASVLAKRGAVMGEITRSEWRPSPPPMNGAREVARRLKQMQRAAAKVDARTRRVE